MANAQTVDDLVNPYHWPVDAVSGWLIEIGLESYAVPFAESKIDGRSLLNERSGKELWQLLIPNRNDREKFLRCVENLKLRVPTTPSDFQFDTSARTSTGSTNPYIAGLQSQLSFRKDASNMTKDEYMAWEMAEQQLFCTGVSSSLSTGSRAGPVASASTTNHLATSSDMPLSSRRYTLSLDREQTLEELSREKDIPIEELLGANPTFSAKEKLKQGQKVFLPVIQRLLNTTAETEPPVSERSVTVFQHFASGHSEPSLIPAYLSEQKLSDIRDKLKGVFIRSDTNIDGFMSLNEFKKFISDLHLEMTDQDVSALFREINRSNADRITFQQFYQYFENIINGERAIHTQSALDLLAAFLKADREGQCELGGISQFINKRWEKFNNFKRDGRTGKLVMIGGREARDILPGEYSLIDLINWSDISPEDKTPRLVKVAKVRWIKSTQPESQSGRLIFPRHFVDVRLPVEYAANDKLAYYGCCLANETQIKVSLLHRHAIQDFTYYDNYYSDYVRGRAGLERHEFAHLDCPFQDDNGFFVLGKFSETNENELHLTAFRIPAKHTLYVPPLTIHSNDYLKGTWRTMLSDATQIDHVRLERERYDGETDRFSFDFIN